MPDIAPVESDIAVETAQPVPDQAAEKKIGQKFQLAQRQVHSMMDGFKRAFTATSSANSEADTSSEQAEFDSYSQGILDLDQKTDQALIEFLEHTNPYDEENLRLEEAMKEAVAEKARQEVVAGKAPLFADKIEVDTQLLSRVELLRRQLNIPEQDETIDPAFEKQKKETVDEFITKKVEGIRQSKKGYIDQHVWGMGDHARSKDVSVIDRVQAATATKVLSARGLDNAEEIVNVFANHRYGVNFRTITSQPVIDSLKTLSASELQTGIDKFAMLGFSVDSSFFSSSEFTSTFRTLSNAGEATIQKVIDELNPYYFLNGPGWQLVDVETKKVNPDLEIITSIIENGGLTDIQKQVLEKANRLTSLQVLPNVYRMGSDGEVVGESASITTLSTLLNNPPPETLIDTLIQNAEDYTYQQLVKFQYDESAASYQHAECSGTMLTNLIALNKNFPLEYLQDLKERGLYIQPIYDDIGRYSFNAENVTQSLTAVYEFTRDPAKLAFTKLLLDSQDTAFRLENIDTYNAYYEQRETLLQLLPIIKTIPPLSGVGFSDVVEYWDQNRDGAKELIIDTKRLAKTIYRLSSYNNDEIGTEEDRMLIQIVNNVAVVSIDNYYSEHEFDSDLLPLASFLATNKGSLDEYFQEFQPTEKLSTLALGEGILTDAGKRKFIKRNASTIDPIELVRNIALVDKSDLISLSGRIPDDVFQRTDLDTDALKLLHSIHELPGYWSKNQLVNYEGDSGDLLHEGKVTGEFLKMAIKAHGFNELEALYNNRDVSSVDSKTDFLVQTIVKVPTANLKSICADAGENIGELLHNGVATPVLINKLLLSQDFQSVDALTNDVFQSGTDYDPQTLQLLQALKKVQSQPLKVVFLKHRDNLEEVYKDGVATPMLINQLLESQDFGSIDILTNDILQSGVDYDPQTLQLLQALKLVPSYDTRNFILKHRDNLEELYKDGMPTPTLVKQIAVSGDNRNLERVLTEEVLSSFTPDEKQYWEYFLDTPYRLRPFMANHQQDFGELIVNGQETPTYYRLLASELPQQFVQDALKDEWRTAFGDEAVNKFLDALPKATDEKRNAFTHNEYDRTTQFMQYMSQSSQDFRLDVPDFPIITEYVQKFGLSKTPVLFHYFKNIYQFEQGQIPELPLDMRESGITTTQEMAKQLKRIREMVYSKKPMTDLSNLSTFETEMLRLITGKSTHTFDSGRPAFERIIQDFQADMINGEIAGVPEGYKTETINASNIKIEFDADAIQEDYDILKNEILESISNPDDVEGLRGTVQEALRTRLVEIQAPSEKSDPKKQEFAGREIARIEGLIAKLDSVKDLDGLVSNLLDMNFGKSEQKTVNGVYRRIIFSKVFQKNFSPGYVQGITSSLEHEISPDSISKVTNTVDEMAKAHALNLSDDNKEAYWSDATFAKIKGSKRGRDLANSFSPHIGKLRQEIDAFRKIQTGGISSISAIPDRGFIGEMSGYLANVCYTAENPLLKKYPNVVPYKFVTTDPGTGEPRFVGSVLVFEVNDSEGNPSLLVRAFDVPQENEIDIQGFIERFLDKMSDVARARGKTRILLPGDQGAISNYPMTYGYIRKKYIEEHSAVSLSERFAFNNHDLTHNSFVAREVTENTSDSLPVAA